MESGGFFCLKLIESGGFLLEIMSIGIFQNLMCPMVVHIDFNLSSG